MLRGCVRVFVAAAAGAAALAMSVATASAGCGTCACGYYAPPMFYAPPPVVYAPPTGCEHFRPQPAYPVDQGPTYRMPVRTAVEPVPEYGDPDVYPDVGYRHRYRATPRFTWLHRPSALRAYPPRSPHLRFVGPRIRVDIDRRPQLIRGPGHPPVRMMAPRPRDPRKS